MVTSRANIASACLRCFTGGLALALLAIVTLATRSRAADLPPDVMFTAGTTTAVGPDGRAWLYVVWNPVDPAAIAGRTFAVYVKPGDPASPAPFARVALAPTALNAAQVAAVLPTATALGEDLVSLDATLNAFASSPAVTAAANTADRLALTVALATTDPLLSKRLNLAALQHPALPLALGRAWAGPVVPGVTTLELRDWDTAAAADRAVVARLTVNAGQPTPLPAPAAPVRVPDLTPAGDLAAGLRWGEPAALRQRAPLVQGFTVWRLPATTARARGWMTHPPSPAELASLGTPVNTAPLVPPRPFTPAEAADLKRDPTTTFLVDRGPATPPWTDGEEAAWCVTARDLLGRDGAASTATLDTICGTRPPATPTALRVENQFDRPPGGLAHQRLRLRWRIPPPGNEPPVDRFEIHRGTGVAPSVTSNSAPDPAGLIASLPANPTPTGEFEFLDRDLDALADPSLWSRTFWYAVRAVRTTACGPVMSAPSQPALGALQRQDAPDAPTGSLVLNCPRTLLRAEGVTLENDPALAGTAPVHHYRLVARRRDEGVAWIDFQVRVVSDTPPAEIELPMARFAEGSVELAVDFELGRAPGETPLLEVTATAGSFTGAISQPVTLALSDRGVDGQRALGRFLAAALSTADLTADDPLAAPLLGSPVALPPAVRDTNGFLRLATALPPGTQLVVQRAPLPAEPAGNDHDVGVLTVPIGGVLLFADPAVTAAGSPPPTYRGRQVLFTQGPQECIHAPRLPGSTRVHALELRVQLTPRSCEYRIHRQIDDGPLTLVAQGAGRHEPTASVNEIVARDDGLPAAGGRVCYFAQVGDEQGHFSPLVPIGCADVAPRALPVPLLAAPEPDGDATSPVMRLAWFCPPEGLDRFVLILAPVAGGAPIQGRSPATTARRLVSLAPQPKPTSWWSKAAEGFQLKPLLVRSNWFTGRIGGELGSGPQFSLPLDVDPGVTYELQVAAMDARGNIGHPSHARRFAWHAPRAVVDKNVPWPARPLPPVTPIDPRLGAVCLETNTLLWPNVDLRAPIGVRLGRIPLAPRESARLDQITGPGEFNGLNLAPTALVTALTRGGSLDTFLFHDTVSDPPHPEFAAINVVLYRQQLANAAYPEVSGDTIQVTPLVPRLAWRRFGSGLAEFLDPFVAVVAVREGDRPDGAVVALDFALQDLHPAVRGARYRYWLVHFTASGEPDRTIPAGEVEVP